jgi:tetratricopeptide (TPR) repeat protein
LQEESFTVLQQIGDTRGMAETLSNLAIVAASSDDLETAVACFEESLAHFRALGDRGAAAGQLENLAVAAYTRGDYQRATTLTEEALAIKRALGNKRGIAIALHNLGNYAERLGQYDRASALYRETLIQSQAQGLSDLSAEGLEGLALVATERWRETLGLQMAPVDREFYDTTVARTRTSLAQEAFSAALALGRLLSPEEAVALARTTG